MDVHSLVLRTELALLQRSGSVVEDRGTHLVVRTPGNPTYFWGNFLLLATPPDDPARVEHWKRVHRTEFPDARHVTLGIDRPGSVADDTALLQGAGMRVEEVVAMTASSVRPPAHPAPADVDLRVLTGDGDWGQQVDLMLAGEQDEHFSREFAARKVAADRELAESGAGAWWGGFVADRLVASLGIFSAGVGLARFQAVKTVEEHRNRGLAGALVVAASEMALTTWGAQTLVMAADPSYAAIRIYRAVGFTEGDTHLEATLEPPP